MECICHTKDANNNLEANFQVVQISLVIIAYRDKMVEFSRAENMGIYLHSYYLI